MLKILSLVLFFSATVCAAVSYSKQGSMSSGYQGPVVGVDPGGADNNSAKGRWQHKRLLTANVGNELRKHEDANVMVSELTQASEFETSCRFMGPIEPPDGLTFPEFIGKVFNDELKTKEIYSEPGIKIIGHISYVDVSSSAAVTRGFWDIAMTLTSSNGESIDVENRYSFESGFNGLTACNATADALTPAVQYLIERAVTSPAFPQLLMSELPST